MIHPATKDVAVLLSEAEAEAAAKPSAPAEDVLSLLRDIRDMLAKFAGEPDGDVSAVPATPEDEPVIPDDAERVEATH